MGESLLLQLAREKDETTRESHVCVCGVSDEEHMLMLGCRRAPRC